MKAISFLTRIFLLCALLGCRSSGYISTAWKNQHAYPGNYNKIMVFAIVNSNDSTYRIELENHFKESLESFGYPAISSYSEFGTALRNMDQEETYKNLCEKGIDAVMTIAWINKENGNDMSYEAYAKPVEFFFDRIWHYKKDQALIPSIANDSGMKYSWEMILYDLPTLQPHYVAQTKTIKGTWKESMKDEFWDTMVRTLRKDKFLKKRPPLGNKTNVPKAF